ncbi:hypothetical protein QUB10_28095, partial [Microcoleus sp. B5-D4]|uniref:hypothetical protein n=1 Tax=unclassified Microcoleus TaxID=2642155 RepID=UPI002FD55ED8
MAIAPALTIELGADCTHAVNTVALSSNFASIWLPKFWIPHSADVIILLVFFKNQSHKAFFSLT